MFYNEAMNPKDAEGMANSADPDQTAPFRGSLIWVCTVCSDLPVPILGILRYSLRFHYIVLILSLDTTNDLYVFL